MNHSTTSFYYSSLLLHPTLLKHQIKQHSIEFMFDLLARRDSIVGNHFAAELSVYSPHKRTFVTKGTFFYFTNSFNSFLTVTIGICRFKNQIK